jgi:hypothetical protein
LAVADETAQIMEYSSQLEAKSDRAQRRPLLACARRMPEADPAVSVQKDAFLSQISHELQDADDLDPGVFRDLDAGGPFG